MRKIQNMWSRDEKCRAQPDVESFSTFRPCRESLPILLVLGASLFLVACCFPRSGANNLQAQDAGTRTRPPAFNALAFSPDGQTIAAATEAGLYLWDAKSGEQLWRWPKEGTGAERNVVAFSPDSKLVISAFDISGYLFDSHTGKTDDKDIGRFCPRVTITRVSFSPDGKELAVGTRTGIVILYSTESWQEIARWEAPRDKKYTSRVVTELVFVSEGKDLLVGIHNEVTRLCQPMMEAKPCYKVVGGDVRSMALSADGKVLVIASGDGSIHGWSLKNEKLLYSFKAHRQATCKVVEISEGCLASVGADGYLRVWDAAKTKKTFEQFVDLDVTNIARSPDGSLIATGGPTIKLWNTTTWKEIPFKGQIKWPIGGSNKTLEKSGK
jgi:WD40 repeat protein